MTPNYKPDVKAENKTASKWLLDINDRRQAYIEKQAAFSELSATAYTGMPHGSGISNPSMNKGVTLVELDKERLWIMTVENTEQTLSEKQRKYLELRREAWMMPRGQGRPPWAQYVAQKYAEWQVNRYGIAYREPDVRTMIGWWQGIVDVAVRIAYRRGCL
jgi:hypothetical protein